MDDTLYPRLVQIKQQFARHRLEDLAMSTKAEMNRVLPDDLAGRRIAITAGSRGIHRIADIIRGIADSLKSRGAMPFIVPAMGSHGGATAEGQIGVLHSLGITEAYCGAPIHSSMETVPIGDTDAGTAVYMDRYAYESDGVVLVNRIKTHTDFKSDIESGLMKMAAIGLGKHKQALLLHSYGISGIRDQMKQVAQKVLGCGKIICGLAILENAYDETSCVEAILPMDIPAREEALLLRSKEMMPSLPIDKIDLLIVDELGKNISGTGMDTNIIGRMRILGEQEPTRPNIKYIFVRDLSEATHGNALGIGLADMTTERAFRKIDFKTTVENVATSTFISRAAIPMVMETDRHALDTFFRCNWGVARKEARIVHIKNTLELEVIRVSEALLPELADSTHVEIVGRPEALSYDSQGNLL